MHTRARARVRACSLSGNSCRVSCLHCLDCYFHSLNLCEAFNLNNRVRCEASNCLLTTRQKSRSAHISHLFPVFKHLIFLFITPPPPPHHHHLNFRGSNCCTVNMGLLPKASFLTHGCRSSLLVTQSDSKELVCFLPES